MTAATDVQENLVALPAMEMNFHQGDWIADRKIGRERLKMVDWKGFV
jgi:hypothetical protein